jgi:demethylmenaquinone methyltransferase/2-methoxy-6-polyprenyl-1,4-benzoquinol methylase
MPKVAKRFASNPDAYIYLAESILAWPNQRDLAKVIAQAGWIDIRWRDLTFGVVAVHSATKPDRISAH